MSEISNVRATFLHYLADNLVTAFTVWNLRFDKANPSQNVPQVNAINVTFHNLGLTGPSTPDDQLVTVDVLYDTEAAAVEAAAAVSNLLFTAAYAPLLDYTLTTPAQISNKLVWWDLQMKFKSVHSDNVFHMSALMKLHYT
jgi:hypothetical protein